MYFELEIEHGSSPEKNEEKCNAFIELKLFYDSKDLEYIFYNSIN